MYVTTNREHIRVFKSQKIEVLASLFYTHFQLTFLMSQVMVTSVTILTSVLFFYKTMPNVIYFAALPFLNYSWKSDAFKSH